MPTLRKCLEALPRDMRLRDLAAIREEDRIKTVEAILAAGRHLNETGFEVVDRPINYGCDTIKAIVIQSMTAYVEERTTS